MRSAPLAVAAIASLTITACGVDPNDRHSAPAEGTVASASRSAAASPNDRSDAVAAMPADPTPQQQATTTTTVPADDACTITPQAPPFLLDGEAPGEPTTTEQGETTLVTWGAVPSGAVPENNTSVRQVLGGESLDVTLPVNSDQLLVAGGYRIQVIPIADPPVGEISIEIVDDQGCLRSYGVGGGVELDEAVAFARAWLSELTGQPASTTTTTAPPAATTLPESR